jgi:hypothetical protein
MKKLFLAMVGLTAMVWAGLPAGAGQAPQAVPPKAETFTIPVAPSAQNAGPPAYLPTTPPHPALPPTGGGLGGGPPSSQQALDKPGALPQSILHPEKASFLSTLQNLDVEQPDPNQDIAVQPSCGPWMICVNWYSGPDAPSQARAMVMELRNNPEYRLNAYVFTKGMEERKAELKRLKKMEEDQLKALATIPDVPADTRLHFSVERSKFELQVAVLVGGYKDKESATRALLPLKELKLPDPTKVKIATQCVFKVDEKTGKAVEDQHVPINPFKFALPVPNPSLPKRGANGPSPEDLALLKKLNAPESFSLLNSPGKYTLIVKKFDVPVTFQVNNGNKSVMDKQNKPADKAYTATDKAHVLAALLRKEKLDAYVLHTEYSSYVTVKSYNRPDDPGLLRDQERLPQYIGKLLEKIDSKAADTVKLLPQFPVMEVPH